MAGSSGIAAVGSPPAAAYRLYLVQEHCSLGDVAAMLASGALAGGISASREAAAAALGIAWMAGAGVAHAHAYG
jgi:hypothetical protein